MAFAAERALDFPLASITREPLFSCRGFHEGSVESWLSLGRSCKRTSPVRKSVFLEKNHKIYDGLNAGRSVERARPRRGDRILYRSDITKNDKNKKHATSIYQHLLLCFEHVEGRAHYVVRPTCCAPPGQVSRKPTLPKPPSSLLQSNPSPLWRLLHRNF